MVEAIRFLLCFVCAFACAGRIPTQIGQLAHLEQLALVQSQLTGARCRVPSALDAMRVLWPFPSQERVSECSKLRHAPVDDTVCCMCLYVYVPTVVAGVV
jgi:hypothetical protein